MHAGIDAGSGSYLRLIDFLLHSNLGLRVMKKKKKKKKECYRYRDGPYTELAETGRVTQDKKTSRCHLPRAAYHQVYNAY